MTLVASRQAISVVVLAVAARGAIADEPACAELESLVLGPMTNAAPGVLPASEIPDAAMTRADGGSSDVIDGDVRGAADATGATMPEAVDRRHCMSPLFIARLARAASGACKEAVQRGQAAPLLERLRAAFLHCEGCSGDCDAIAPEWAMCLLAPRGQLRAIRQGFLSSVSTTQVAPMQRACFAALLADGGSDAFAAARWILESNRWEVVTTLLPIARAAGGESARLLLASALHGANVLREIAGHEALYREVCSGPEGRGRAEHAACAEAGAHPEAQWAEEARTAASERDRRVAAEAERNLDPRSERLRWGIAWTLSGALTASLALALTGGLPDTDVARAVAVGAGVAGGASLGFDIALLILGGDLHGKDISLGRLGAAGLAILLGGIAGGIGSWFATANPGWSRFATVGVVTAVTAPQFLWFAWRRDF